MNIFGIGLPEMAVIAAIGLLVFGPKRLPELGRTLGRTLKGFQSASTNFEQEFRKAIDSEADTVVTTNSVAIAEAPAPAAESVAAAPVAAVAAPDAPPASEPPAAAALAQRFSSAASLLLLRSATAMTASSTPGGEARTGDLQLVVGLGNPGDKYVRTRHNVCFMALERLAARERVSFRANTRMQGLLADVGQGAQRLRLLMPTTYMNESGRSIRATLDWFGLRPDQMLVLVDDMDLPLGRLRLRLAGSAGGHNGLRSTISQLGSQEFPRLRIGISAPADDPITRKARTISHVLGRFEPSEQACVEAVLDEVLAGLGVIQRLGYERAGNRLNSFQPTTA